VDLLKIIQLGITLSDAEGRFPPEVCTWQFNFHFSLKDDMYAQESIDLLTNSGIDFNRHELYGIDVNDFGEVLTISGLVFSKNIKWISFHSGYDFAYLLKVLTCNPLPPEEEDFFEVLNIIFPCVYDIKYLMKTCKTLKGGLQDVADSLGVQRIGPQHQAGSDCLLTAQVFFKMLDTFFEGKIDDAAFMGCLYGLGNTANIINQSEQIVPQNK
jgi:CCR4-NOT transcription complex subunit 7/8